MGYSNHGRLRALLLAGTLLSASVSAAPQGAGWQPVSSEKLIRLPANYISQTVESDYLASPLAAQIDALDQSMNETVTTLHELKATIAAHANETGDEAGDEQLVELKHQFLQAKSDYLDLMEQKQRLDQQGLETRRKLFEKVLVKINRVAANANSREVIELKQAQQNARKRMQSAMALVDNALLEADDGKGDMNSDYRSDYRKNVAKLEALRSAINAHEANETPAIDGQTVSKADYVRHLLTSLNVEQAIFDQEKLMLGYMAKLVAMDAQALEHQLLAQTHEDDSGKQRHERSSLAANTDLFIAQ